MLLGMSERGELFCHWPEEQPITNKEQEAGMHGFTAKSQQGGYKKSV